MTDKQIWENFSSDNRKVDEEGNIYTVCQHGKSYPYCWYCAELIKNDPR